MRKFFPGRLLLMILLLISFPSFGDTPIQGESLLDAQQMWEFVVQHNPDFPRELADHYYEVGKIYGIRGDIALCQAIIETGWFKFKDGTAVSPNQYNYCGLGVLKLGTKGLSFSSPRDGVTAQMQHLFAYASTAPLPKGEQKLDSRFGMVNRGSSKTWEGLSGKWAANPHYGDQILALYKKMTTSVANNPKSRSKKSSEGSDRKTSGTVGEVTARHVGIAMSEQQIQPDDHSIQLDFSETELSANTNQPTIEKGSKANIKKNKKSNKKKSKKKKSEKNRKIPKKAVRAKLVENSSGPARLVNITGNDSKEENISENSVTTAENQSSEIINEQTAKREEEQPLELRAEKDDTVTVSRTSTRSVKVVRRR